ncbi:MAG: cardiolipin synthase [Clostridia bacterium]|nr:cardiolipin synthase [Clostridia bacterium]
MRKLSKRKKKWIERTVANDRSYKIVLYNRFFLFLLAVLWQLVGYALLILAFAYDSTIGATVQLVVGVLAILFVLRIINRNERPSSKLSWIILILIFPVFGVPTYLFSGGGRPTRDMRKKIARAKAENNKRLEKEDAINEETRSRENAISRYLSVCGGYPVYKSGTIDYYKCGEEAFPEMLAALEKAEKFILVEYFIIAHGKMWNEILKRLVEKAMQGVRVRIIYDDFGCMVTLPPKYELYLESLHENIKCMTFNDVVPFFSVRMNNRDHRKMLVIDGKVAFTGGINLADEYINEKERFGYWKDSALKITGAAVNSFTEMFFYMWNAFRKDKEELREYILPQETEKETGIVIHPYDDSPLDNISVGESAYVDLINRASKSVWIFTPYLVLDDFLRASLCQAALRGVDVRIVTPGIPDKKTVYRLTRANYAPLMKSGVKIYEYAPGFIHAKSMVCDGEAAIVGTINLDYRSLYHHFENAVYFSGCKAVDEVKRDCEETFAISKLCTPENTKRGFFGKLIDSMLRVFETLL